MLEIKNLQKGYNNRTVIHGINICIDRGEIHGLVGSNGAGKTTLLKCAAGIYKPAQGTVQYDEKDIYDNPEMKAKVAYVSEQLDFINIYSVAGMAKYYQNFYDTFSGKKFDDLVKRFGINPKKNIGTLSKGQRSKLNFILAIAQQPEYLIMDEPESGMDSESKAIFRDILIEEVDREQIGVLLASHDLADVERMCDSVTMMETGEVFAQKSVDEFMESVQKWKGILPQKTTDDKLFAMTVHAASGIGDISEFYTVGEREESERILNKLGIGDYSGQQITLEEIYTLLKKIYLQGKGMVSGIQKEGGLKNE
ncbi:MAG: ABC transporter ATP-binding protein [Lachnospiraceae bacterium]|nr:ABC transporter ATP-binding protein [Lachnospiraceae bacterium]